MVKVWVVRPHLPSVFPHTLIRIVDGQRQTDEFVKKCATLSEVSCVDIDDNDQFLGLCIKELGLNQKNRGNTISLGKSLHMCYMQDYVAYINDAVKERGEEALPTGVVHNYFGTLVNIEGENVHGNAIVYKLDENQLVDANEEQVFELISNFYFVKCYQVRNGELVEITFPNIEPVIAESLKDKKKHLVDCWEFYLPPDAQCDITDLGVKQVDINSFNNLIILKRKECMKDVWNALADLKKKLRPDDLRGLYEDLDREYIKGFFSV